MRRTTRLIAAAVAASALILSACESSDSSSRQRNSSIAKDESGLNLSVWRVDTSKGSSPLFGYDSVKELGESYADKTKCAGADTTVSKIDDVWGTDVVANCAQELVMMHYTGYINIPGNPGETRKVIFNNVSDDGFWLAIDDKEIISDWSVKPCSGKSAKVLLPAQTKLKFEAWYFENFDQACNTLKWILSGGRAVAIPPSAFARDTVSAADDDSSSTSSSSTEAPSTTTSSIDEPTTTSTTDEETTTSTTVKKTTTTASSSPDTSSTTEAPTTTAGGSGSGDTTTTQATVVKQIIVDDTTPITVPEGAKELACDLVCVDSIRKTLGVTGDVYATVAGKKVLLNGKTSIPTNGAKVVFSNGADKSITVVLEVAPAVTGSSGEDSSFPWWIIIVAIVVLAGGGYTAATRKKKTTNQS